MPNSELSVITAALADLRSCVILTHRGPDGDAVGSAAALCRGLRALGKDAWVLNNPGFTLMQRPFLKDLTCDSCPEGAVILSVDLSTEGLLPDAFQPYVGQIAISIDHHPSNSFFARLNLVDPSSAACGEIIHRILVFMGAAEDRQTAEAIYLAVSTDTGCFRFSNTSAETLRTAADMKELGADTFSINRAFFSTRSRARIELEKRLLNSLEFLADGLVCIVSMPQSWLSETGASEDDTDGLSDIPRSVRGVEVAAMIRECENGRTKVSVRTGPDYDASAICRHFGGGGHKAAAGGSIDGSMEEMHSLLLSAIAAEGVVL